MQEIVSELRPRCILCEGLETYSRMQQWLRLWGSPVQGDEVRVLRPSKPSNRLLERQGQLMGIVHPSAARTRLTDDEKQLLRNAITEWCIDKH
jgi:hypothetical protein